MSNSFNAKEAILTARKTITVNPGQSFFGYDVNHTPVYLNWEEVPVWNILGISGSGRTRSMFPVYLELATNYDTYVIDGKEGVSILDTLAPEATLVPMVAANNFLDVVINRPNKTGKHMFIIVNLPNAIESFTPGFCERIMRLARICRAYNTTIFLADTRTSFALREVQNLNYNPDKTILFPYHCASITRMDNSMYGKIVDAYYDTPNVVLAQLDSTHTEPTIIYPHNPYISYISYDGKTWHGRKGSGKRGPVKDILELTNDQIRKTS